MSTSIKRRSLLTGGAAAAGVAGLSALGLPGERTAEFRPVANKIAAAALAAYRALVETEGFAEWLARISPLEEIGGMRASPWCQWLS